VKSFICLLAFLWCVMGCATKTTIQSRQQERSGAYAALTPEQRALIDQGQIKSGMSEDAVYVAWGRPSELLKGESGGNPTTTWVYTRTAAQERRYWNLHRHDPANIGGAYRFLPTIDSEYVPMRRTTAEVVFENGLVKSWRQIAPPATQ
jgi:hypothetical protein